MTEQKVVDEEVKEATVSLEEYGKRVKVIVEEFVIDQRAMHSRRPNDWPLNTTLGAWDERFFIFMITKD